MPLCLDHMQGEMPRFLKYTICDECAEIYEWRKREGGRRRAKATRENRKTARINGRPATGRVSTSLACVLPKADSWHRPHTWFRRKCKNCERKKPVGRKVAT